MSRKKITKREIAPDAVYDNVIIAKFINQIMKKGKKNTAKKVVYGALDIIKEKTQKDPIEVFELALNNARPLLEVKSQRIGGATYQVPKPVVKERGMALAVRWLLESARKKKGQPMREKLAEEFINAANNTGVAVKKKEDTHRMAEANRAFAHFKF
ncbi:MAG TPA: 30S ribosomal protein S7 [Candidatus Paceibacterota bacterium]|nr:30S ribosomal protein S7 [Candidatus Pacearchaeota archaeon]HRZ50944.1 30S ribosomal protein S7 [Candidatus Paceibacterota bacterium]HSA36665.1 30S ribosomal protein S7 [Candidatus Paceibacterota bacterium]